MVYFLRNWAPGWLTEEFDVCLLPNRVLHVLWLQNTNQHQTLMTPFHERVLFQDRNPLGLESCLFVSPTTWRMLLYIGKKNLPHQANIYISLVLHKMVYKPICHVKPCTLWEKKYHKAHFWCFRLSQIKDSIQYLEGPNCTWTVHDRNIFCPDGPQDYYHGPSRYYLVLPGTE